METFDGHKKEFTGREDGIKMDLPAPLHNLDIPGKVSGGEITITKYANISVC